MAKKVTETKKWGKTYYTVTVYVCARYSPPGNFANPGYYKANVLPDKAGKGHRNDQGVEEFYKLQDEKKLEKKITKEAIL